MITPGRTVQIKNQKFILDEDDSGNGWLEWDELVIRKGFRPAWHHRRIRKEAHHG